MYETNQVLARLTFLDFPTKKVRTYSAMPASKKASVLKTASIALVNKAEIRGDVGITHGLDGRRTSSNDTQVHHSLDQ